MNLNTPGRRELLLIKEASYRQEHSDLNPPAPKNSSSRPPPTPSFYRSEGWRSLKRSEAKGALLISAKPAKRSEGEPSLSLRSQALRRDKSTPAFPEVPHRPVFIYFFFLSFRPPLCSAEPVQPPFIERSDEREGFAKEPFLLTEFEYEGGLA